MLHLATNHHHHHHHCRSLGCSRECLFLLLVCPRVSASTPGLLRTSPAVLAGNHGSSRPTTQRPTADRIQNFVFFGIRESPPGTPHQEKMEHDYNSVFATIDPMIISGHLHAFIHVCSHLSKYDASSQCPRPVLVEFNNLSNIKAIFYNIQSLPAESSVTVRRDMSKKEQQTNSILLKECYRLVTKCDISRHDIKFKGKVLYVKGSLHGEAGSEGFMASRQNTSSVVSPSSITPCFSGSHGDSTCGPSR